MAGNTDNYKLKDGAKQNINNLNVKQMETNRKRAEEFLKDKRLRMQNPLEGYIIPYSELVNLLVDFSNQQNEVELTDERLKEVIDFLEKNSPTVEAIISRN